jgi:hypothetical protein
MARSPEDLANAALGYLLRDTIRSLDGSSPAAVQTKQHLATAMEEVMEEYDWPECRVVTDLTVASGVALRGWAFAYTLPSDALKIWYVGDARRTKTVPFERGMSADLSTTRSYIFTDLAGAQIRYSSKRATIDRFSAQVFDLMALLLAKKCCMPLTKDKRMQDSIQKEYELKLSKVKTLYAMSEPEVVSPDFVPELITVRSE